MDQMKYYTVNYLNKTYEFSFNYKRQHDGYRAYITSQPDYRNRSTSLSDTHRLRDGDKYYICWSQPIPTEQLMDGVVALWCRATVMYIIFGGDLRIHAENIQRS